MLGLKQTNKCVKEIQHPEFGAITIERRKGVRRINLSIRPGNVIKVTLPYGVAFSYGENFIAEKYEWIKQNLNKISTVKPTVFTENTEYSTHFHKLKIIPSNFEVVKFRRHNGLLEVYYPQNADILSSEIQTAISRCILKTLRAEAKIYLPQRTEYLAQLHGFKYGKIHIKANTNSLGSCSYVNNLNYSLHIMCLSNDLIDYIILHELCHTVEKNHGDGFWQLLDSVTNNQARELSRRSKKLNTLFL